MRSAIKNTSSGLCTNEAFSEQVVTLKYCFYSPFKRCFHSSCSFLDRYGNVKLCPLHPNPSGRFMRRKVVQ
jgi:hypothetical protein